MELSNGIIAVAEAAKSDLVDMGVSPKRIKVIINGVKGISVLSKDERSRIRSSLSIPEDAVVVGIFARLEEYKGHKDLIEAASILLSYSDAYRFLIVGGGSLEEKLKNICREKGIDDKFVFTGFVDDVTEYFNITDINVNCSHGTETSSLALSEGMSLGIPCIASDFGGNSYMVQDGINGYVYPAYDSHRLAVLIERSGNDAVLRKRLSENAYIRFKSELNHKKMTEATYNYYTQLRSVKM
jgi:glycosyltransferase involved in cell wall biosynthesis